jgi:uncharacterized protein YeaO (DUF488 family)
VALEVWTARISTRDPDALNVTRKSGDKTFAPSWALLGPMVDIRRSGKVATEEQWKDYAKAYIKEMFASRARHPEEWARLLGRSRVVLTCYCTNPKRCHRTILGRILERLGATFWGELEGPATIRDCPPAVDALKEHQAEVEGFELAMSLDDD